MFYFLADPDVRGSPPYRLESDSLSHVSKLGIKLKTSAHLPRNDSRRFSAGHRESPDGKTNKPHYIENIVVPVSTMHILYYISTFCSDLRYYINL